MKKEAVREDYGIVLIFPPQWTPQNPHYALTSLAGHLRHNGYKVNLRDLNVEFYDKILKPDYIEYAKHKTFSEYEFLKFKYFMKFLVDDIDPEANIEIRRILHIENFLKTEQEAWKETSRLIESSVEFLKNPERFYQPDLLIHAFTVIDDALKIISLPYYPDNLSFNNFEHPAVSFNLKNVLPYCIDSKRNMFYEFYEEVIPEILALKPDLIGLSINSYSQVLPGLTLAKMLKEKSSESHINIGGNYFGRVKESLLNLPEFFHNFCHSLIMGEGEKFLLDLIETLRTGRDISEVPSILYMKNEKIKYTYKGMPEKFNNTGIQDLAGLKLDKYFTPDIVLCIQSSKGCYWGKCTFCDADFGIEHDVKSLDRLIKEIKHLKDNYNIRHYEFMDEVIPIEYMRNMAERLIEENLDIYWFSNGRLETDFTPEFLELLHKAGLTMILWGFESGNRRIMGLINKGIDPDRRYEILKSSKDSGIWNFVYIFFGFPTETKEEAMDTINALCKHKDIIHCYGKSVFTLGKHSLLKDEAHKYGIIDIIEDNQELSTTLYYKSSGGMNEKEIYDIMKLCTERCKKAYNMPLWMYLKYRENIHLYLAKYGVRYVENYPTNKLYPTKQLIVW